MAMKTPRGPKLKWLASSQCERNFPAPEAADVDEGRRPGVARAVERLRQHHAQRVHRETQGDDPDGLDARSRAPRGCR